MHFIHAVFVYVYIVNVCVSAKGGHGSHAGSHTGSHVGSHVRTHVKVHGVSHTHGGSYGVHPHGGGSQGGHAPGFGPHGHYVRASHTHYAYHPPRYIAYQCRDCLSSEHYPVYRPTPPSYVYVFKDSYSRYNDILTGLSLYNLGRSTETGWTYTHHYTSQPRERCSLQVIARSHFEETEFPCFMISSFIGPTATKTNDSSLVDISSSEINVKPFLEDVGPPLEVTSEQECVLWHNLTMHKERNHVPCTLLKEYANTLRRSGVPSYIWVPTLMGIIICVYSCIWCYCKKKEKETIKEEVPLNDLRVHAYSSNY